MPHPMIARLQQLLPPPPSGGDVVDWVELSTSTGLSLPTDYREFVEVYGGGEIDKYVSVSTPPVNGSPYGDLLDGMDPALPSDAETELTSQLQDEGVPRLLSFGTTASSDVIFWLRRGSPDEWKIVVFRRQIPRGTSEWSVFDSGMAEFLCAFLSGAIDPFSQVSPEGEPHTYVSWRDDG
jgi:hypothetical protein